MSKKNKQLDEEGFSDSSVFLIKLISKLAPNPRKVEEWVATIEKENPKLSKDQIADYIGDYIVLCIQSTCPIASSYWTFE